MDRSFGATPFARLAEGSAAKLAEREILRAEGAGWQRETVRYGRFLETVDVFAALTTDRRFRPALQAEDAYEVLMLEVERGERLP